MVEGRVFFHGGDAGARRKNKEAEKQEVPGFSFPGSRSNPRSLPAPQFEI
jgi:hypothetical protein